MTSAELLYVTIKYFGEKKLLKGEFTNFDNVIYKMMPLDSIAISLKG